MKDKGSRSAKQIITLVLMMLSLCTIYLLPYLMYTYYTPLQEAMGLLGQDKAYGRLLNVYGILNVILYIPGGWICDRFDAKKLLVISMIGTGILGCLEATWPSYTLMMLIFLGYSVTTVLTYWSASIKCINLVAGSDEQGSMYGALEAGRGVVGLLLTTVFVAIYAKFTDLSNTAAMTRIVLITGILMIVIGVLIWIFFPQTSVEGSTNSNIKESLKAYAVAFKVPVTYLLSGMILAACVCQATLSYFGPYLENIIGVDQKVVIFFTNYNRTVCTLISASVAAILAKKCANSAKVIIYAGIGDAICYLLMLIIPGSKAIMIPVMIIMILSTLFYAVFRALYYASMEETGLQKNSVGSVIAIASIIGFAPDMFFTTMCGGWLEADPVGGYKKIWISCIIVAVVGIVCAIITAKLTDKHNKAIAAK